jgi:hypothetical protein
LSDPLPQNECENKIKSSPVIKMKKVTISVTPVKEEKAKDEI